MQNLSIKLSLFLILTNISFQVCNKGCQYCEEGVCKQCDLKNNYFLNATTLLCELASVDCVDIKAETQICTACKNDKYPDTTNKGQCVANTTLNIAPNCITFSADGDCFQCKPEYYTNDNKDCVLLSSNTSITPDPNCIAHYFGSDPEYECYKCNEGYSVSETEKYCIPNKADSNCDHFSTYFCYQCYYDFYEYPLTAKKFAFYDDFVTQSANISYEDWFGNSRNVCNINNTECFERNADNSCASCDNKSFPSEILIECQQIVSEFCAELYDHELCKKCIDGYYQAAEGQCVSELGEGCKKKKHKVKKVKEEQNDTKKVDKKNIAYQGCSKCNSKNQYYNGTTNKCTDVTVVDSCKKYHQFKNECLKCKSGNIILSSSKKCAKKIKHCHTYSNPGITASTSICLKCIHKRYFNAGECKKPKTKIKFCQSYSNATTCEECTKFKFVKSNACEKRTKTKHCDEFVPNEDKCKKCNDHYLVNASGECVKIDDKNCLQGELNGTKQVCTECKKKYFIENDGSCSKIKEKCGKGNFINPDTKQCVNKNEGVANCQVYSAQGVCKYCDSKYFLESPTSCVERTGSNITGCLFYNSDSKCLLCTDVLKFVTEDGLSCVDPTAFNCVTYSSDGTKCTSCYQDDTLNETQTECQGAITNCNKYDQTSSTPKCLCCNGSDLLPDGTCSAIVTTNINSNCECYIEKNAAQERLCGKCIQTLLLAIDKKTCHNTNYDGLKNLISNCFYFSELEQAVCSLCKPGFYANEEGVCVEDPTVTITGCIYQEISECQICGPGYTHSVEKTCTLHANVVQLYYDYLFFKEIKKFLLIFLIILI